MQFKQLPRSGDRDGEGPSLIDLFDDIERAILEWMEPNLLKFHPAKKVERVTRL